MIIGEEESVVIGGGKGIGWMDNDTGREKEEGDIRDRRREGNDDRRRLAW